MKLDTLYCVYFINIIDKNIETNIYRDCSFLLNKILMI